MIYIILLCTLLLGSFAYCCQPPNQNNAASIDTQEIVELKKQVQELRSELADYCGPTALNNSRRERNRMFADLKVLEEKLKEFR